MGLFDWLSRKCPSAAAPQAMRRYDYPTGNAELATRHRAGEPLQSVLQEIRVKWQPGNEFLWDEYDIESLIDTDEKRRYTVNQLIYSRITVFRALRAAGQDIHGRDPIEFIGLVPDVFERLKALFPDTLARAGREA